MERATEVRAHGDRRPPRWVRAARRLRSGVVRLLGLGAPPARAGRTERPPLSEAPPGAAATAEAVTAETPPGAAATADAVTAETPPGAAATAEAVTAEAPPGVAVTADLLRAGGATDGAEDRASAEITEMTASIGRQPLRRVPLISVLLVTTGEPADLDAVVASVRDQAYDAWELVVVDDRSPPAPPGFPAAGDGRVRVLAGPRLGAAAAHNRGLEAASGQIVTYLSAGAHMAPGWLAALAWASDEYPGTGLFVGTRAVFTGAPRPDPAASLAKLVAEDRVRLHPAGSGGDHLSALAHHRELAGARVDEGTGVDPDEQLAMVVAALEHGTDPRRLPVLASLTVAPVAPPPSPSAPVAPVAPPASPTAPVAPDAVPPASPTAPGPT